MFLNSAYETFSSQAKSEKWYKVFEKLKTLSGDFCKSGVKKNICKNIFILGKLEKKTNVKLPNRINEQIKFISLERIEGIIAFLSNLNNQESLAPPIMDILAENKTALYIGSISLKLKFIEKLKFALCHLLKYIIRSE